MERELVLPVAQRLIERLAPACNDIQLAGSLRRGKQQVKDIEICAVPIFECQADLFGGMPALTERTPGLDWVLAQAVAEDVLTWDTQTRRNGLLYKRLIVTEIGCVVELFLASSANFGVTFAIRTGSAEFAKAFVKPRQWDGGLLPDNMAIAQGHLWRFRSSAAAFAYRRAAKEGVTQGRALLKQATLIVCATEEAFFEEIGLPVLPPEKREEGALDWLKRSNAYGGSR